jgi:4'-phosphopantetheinyl transferase
LKTTAQAWLLFLDEIESGALKTTCLDWLSADELARYHAFSGCELQTRFLAGTALCRRSLSHYAPVEPSEWRFARTANGKPEIVEPSEFRSLEFSLARTNGLAICLVTRAGKAGVDVEDTSRTVDVAAIARHFLPASERKRLEGLPQDERTARLFKIWVLHEAQLKASGKGLGEDGRIRVRVGPDGAPLPSANWKFTLHNPSARHVAAVAIHQPADAPLVPVRWSKSSLFETRVAVED